MIMKQILKYFGIIITVLLIGVGCERYDVPKVDYKDTFYPTRIYGSTLHAAFPSLVKFNNAFYCAFREGPAHEGAGGVIRIIKSADGVHWETVDVLEFPGEGEEENYLAFNGVNQYMTITKHADLDYASTSENLSFFARVRAEGNGRIVSKQAAAVDGYELLSSGGRLFFHYRNPYASTQSANADLNGEWRHVGFVYDGTSKELKIY